jgi:hypothetical protein
MERDHVIEALSTNGSHHSLHIGSLPRLARCRQDFADAHVSHLFLEVIAQRSELSTGSAVPERSQLLPMAEALSRLIPKTDCCLILVIRHRHGVYRIKSLLHSKCLIALGIDRRSPAMLEFSRWPKNFSLHSLRSHL